MNTGHAADTAKPCALCGANRKHRFSFYEAEFARHVFHPFAANSILSAKDAAWLGEFAASVCWRIIEEGISQNLPDHLFGNRTSALVACRETWRAYLLGKRPDAGGYHLPLLPSGAVVRQTGAGAVHSLHTIESHVFCDEPAAFMSV